jgi:hypothetical protein
MASGGRGGPRNAQPPATQKILERVFYDYRDARYQRRASQWLTSTTCAAVARCGSAASAIRRPSPLRGRLQSDGRRNPRAGPDSGAWTRSLRELPRGSRHLMLFSLKTKHRKEAWRQIAWLPPSGLCWIENAQRQVKDVRALKPQFRLNRDDRQSLVRGR